MYVYGAKENNLNSVCVQTIDNGVVTVVGDSGSGKSTLIYNVLGFELERRNSIDKSDSYSYEKFHRKKIDYLSDEISNVQYLSQRKNQSTESSNIFTFSGIADIVRRFWIRKSVIECPNCKKNIFENNLEAVKKNILKNDIAELFVLDKKGKYYFDIDGYQLTKKRHGDKSYKKIDINDLSNSNFHSCIFTLNSKTHNMEHEVICSNCESITLKKHRSLLIKNFDSPFSGKCKCCDGSGFITSLNENILFNEEDAVLDSLNIPFDGKYYKYIYLSKRKLKSFLKKEGIPSSLRINEIEKSKKELLKKYLYELITSYKNKNLMQYIEYISCNKCNGSGFNDSARSLKINGISIHDIENNNILYLEKFVRELYPSEYQLVNYIEFFKDIALDQYKLNTLLTEVSNGEKQRLRILRSITINTNQQMIVLDEPSSGLHPYNIFQLINVIYKASIENLVLMSEHSQLLVSYSDQIIKLGSESNDNRSIVLSNKKVIYNSYKDDLFRRKDDKEYNKIYINNININNVTNQNIFLFEESINILTGVSGSGKTSILTAINHHLDNLITESKSANDLDYIYLDSEPMSQSKSSTIATFLNINNYIRSVFTEEFKFDKKVNKSWFSKNTAEGKCDFCSGTSFINSEVCSFCNGEGANPKAQLLKINNNNIYDVLNIPIYEIKEFNILDIYIKFKCEIDNLIDFQLGHLSLGRSLKTLSGGEAQRLKLSEFLCRKVLSSNLIVIMDEPTVGLGKKETLILMEKLNLYKINYKTTLLLVEHNPYVISQANNIIEVGPHSGVFGGQITFNGSLNDYLVSKGTHIDLLNRDYFVETEQYKKVNNKSLNSLLDLSDMDESYFYNKYFLQLKIFFNNVNIDNSMGYSFERNIDKVIKGEYLINPFINIMYHFQKVPVKYITMIVDILLFIGVDSYHLIAEDNSISKPISIKSIDGDSKLANIWVDANIDKNSIKKLSGGVVFDKRSKLIVTNRVFHHLHSEKLSPQLTSPESLTLSNFICKMCSLHKYVLSHAILEDIREDKSDKLIENKIVSDLISSNIIKFKIKPIFKYFQEQRIFDFDRPLSDYSTEDFDYILYGCNDRFYPTKSLLKRDSMVWKGLVSYIENSSNLYKKVCPQCQGVGFNSSTKCIKSNDLYFDNFIKLSANL